jgi:hypothetical protein
MKDEDDPDDPDSDGLRPLRAASKGLRDVVDGHVWRLRLPCEYQNRVTMLRSMPGLLLRVRNLKALELEHDLDCGLDVDNVTAEDLRGEL